MPAPFRLPSNPQKHTPLEDIQGLATALITASVGLVFLQSLGFITGQTAGLALVLSYITGQPFGLVFFLVNLPFYGLAWFRMGKEFTLKSLGTVAVFSVLVELMPTWITFETLNPVMGVIAFGTLTGFGLLGIFRHKASLGGLGVLALYIQDRYGIRAGFVQLGFDAVLFSVAAFLFAPRVVLFSLLGAVILNGIIAFNHRRDWYVAT